MNTEMTVGIRRTLQTDILGGCRRNPGVQGQLCTGVCVHSPPAGPRGCRPSVTGSLGVTGEVESLMDRDTGDSSLCSCVTELVPQVAGESERWPVHTAPGNVRLSLPVSIRNAEWLQKERIWSPSSCPPQTPALLPGERVTAFGGNEDVPPSFLPWDTFWLSCPSGTGRGPSADRWSTRKSRQECGGPGLTRTQGRETTMRRTRSLLFYTLSPTHHTQKIQKALFFNKKVKKLSEFLGASSAPG